MPPTGSQRVDRRRRVLVDESRNETPWTRPRIFRGDDEGPLSRYDEAALRALNAPIARYLPFRAFSLVMWFLTGFIPVMGLVLLDQRRFQIAQWLGEDALRVFHLNSHGSLARWCSSITFVIAALVILAIYSVRRHRRDDYRARFTVWQWVLPIAILASIDSSISLHGLLQRGMDRSVGPLSWGAGSAWWVTAWALLITVVTIQLAFEMSASRKSFGWMVGGVLCYLGCGCLQLEFIGQDTSTGIASSQAALLLVGHHFVLFALVSYARDVIREAMGIVDSPEKVPEANAQAAPKKKTKATERASAKQASNTPALRRTFNDSATPQQDTSKNADRAKTLAEPLEDVEQPMMKVVSQDGEHSVDLSTLSRAERKRLKKEMRRKKAA